MQILLLERQSTKGRRRQIAALSLLSFFTYYNTFSNDFSPENLIQRGLGHYLKIDGKLPSFLEYTFIGYVSLFPSRAWVHEMAYQN